MRNKELVNRKLEQIDGQLQTIKVMSTRSTTTVQDIHESISKCEDLINQVKSMVDREPMSGQDVNPFIQ
jgi:archaellum component FlaC